MGVWTNHYLAQVRPNGQEVCTQLLITHHSVLADTRVSQSRTQVENVCSAVITHPLF